jgi:hypothetical protein
MNGRCAIMQPTFFPWSGYFNLMGQVDEFVFLDDVQLEKQSWQTRNRILDQGEASFIIAPIENAGLDQTLATTQLHDPARHLGKLARRLTQVYGRHPHGRAMLDRVLPVLAEAPALLAEFNIRLIGVLAAGLGLAPACRRASQLDAAGARSERLLRLCGRLGCDHYLSPTGSADYLREDRFTELGDIHLEFQAFSPSPYRQSGYVGPFVSHLSVVDVIANLGWEGAARYVKGNPP